jgi:hypothetical protein
MFQNLKHMPKEMNGWREHLVATLLRDVYRIMRNHTQLTGAFRGPCKLEKVANGLVYGSEELSEARCEQDISYVLQRCANEGVVFLTETLPRLGKALDSALSYNTECFLVEGFDLRPETKMPIFLSGIFSFVFDADGHVLKDACPQAIRHLRQVLFVFYKLKLPLAAEKSNAVIESFVQTELDLATSDNDLINAQQELDAHAANPSRVIPERLRVIMSARWLLTKALSRFSLESVIPSHGPGAVSGKEKPWEKWDWTMIPDRTLEVFPLDRNFFCSMDDLLCRSRHIIDAEPSARVILVPKDSRGPRLISAEPKEFQFLQQGMMRHLVQLVERSPLTKWSVFFTNQVPNQKAALLSSERGERSDSYSTLDLKDASDRVSLELVRLLFPARIFDALDACRSRSTTLPNGVEIRLRKHAPMGSATCFPVMALCIWSILAAKWCCMAGDPWLKKNKTLFELEMIHVYGDDVIVPIGYTGTAIEELEKVGLRVNRQKSCFKGLFRESCGMDAFKGIRVTPLRISADWGVITAQQRYCSYIAYANAFGSAGYHLSGEFIARLLHTQFSGIPAQRDIPLGDAPALLDEYVGATSLRTRTDRLLQKRVVRVRVPKARIIKRRQNGWISLLRFFTEMCSEHDGEVFTDAPLGASVALNEYTQRRDSSLTWRWCTTAPKGAGTIV